MRYVQLLTATRNADYFESDSITLPFGLCDACLQSAGINNDTESMALLTVVHVKLFGEEVGTKVVGQSFQEQEDPTFAKGRMVGGQELVEFFRSKKPTMGLASYLLNGEMR